MKRMAGIICLVVAPWLFISGTSLVMKLEWQEATDVSQAVGAYLPFMLLLIIGLKLIQKPKEPDGPPPGK